MHDHVNPNLNWFSFSWNPIWISIFNSNRIFPKPSPSTVTSTQRRLTIIMEIRNILLPEKNWAIFHVCNFISSFIEFTKANFQKRREFVFLWNHFHENQRRKCDIWNKMDLLAYDELPSIARTLEWPRLLQIEPKPYSSASIIFQCLEIFIFVVNRIPYKI